MYGEGFQFGARIMTTVMLKAERFKETQGLFNVAMRYSLTRKP